MSSANRTTVNGQLPTGTTANRTIALQKMSYRICSLSNYDGWNKTYRMKFLAWKNFEKCMSISKSDRLF